MAGTIVLTDNLPADALSNGYPKHFFDAPTVGANGALGDYGTPTTFSDAFHITDTTKTWTINQWSGATVVMGGQTNIVLSNTATALAFATPFNPNIVALYIIYPPNYLSLRRARGGMTEGAAGAAGYADAGMVPLIGDGWTSANAVTANSGQNNLIDTTQNWIANQWVGHLIQIVPTGSPSDNETRTIVSNTATTLTVDPAWSVLPVFNPHRVTVWAPNLYQISLARPWPTLGAGDGVGVLRRGCRVTIKTPFTALAIRDISNHNASGANMPALDGFSSVLIEVINGLNQAITLTDAHASSNFSPIIPTVTIAAGVSGFIVPWPDATVEGAVLAILPQLAGPIPAGSINPSWILTAKCAIAPSTGALTVRMVGTY